MPDYAEVAGCSTFRNNNTTSPLYDSYGAYATTNLVRNANIFTNNFHNSNKNSVYSAPTICHFNTNTGTSTTSTAIPSSSLLDGHNFAYSDTNYPTNKNATAKMNIIENKFDVINNLNRSTTSVTSAATVAAVTTCGSGLGMSNGTKTFQSTPHINASSGTMKRNRLPKIGHCDKISFGGCDNGRNIDQPLFIKSKEDGSWTSVQNSSYHFSVTSTPTKSIDNQYIKTNSNIITNNHISHSHNNINNNSNFINNTNNMGGGGSLSSFGKSDNV